MMFKNTFSIPILGCSIFLSLAMLGSLPKAALSQDAGDDASLDQQLLDDLGSDLFGDFDLPDEEEASPSAKSDESTEKQGGKAEEPDQDLHPSDDTDEGQRGFGAGDMPTGQENPLIKIGELMRSVQQRMAQGEADSGTIAMQQEIVDEIEKLLKQQQNSNSSPSSNSNNEQPSQQQSQQDQQQNQNQNQQQKGNSGQPSPGKKPGQGDPMGGQSQQKGGDPMNQSSSQESDRPGEGEGKGENPQGDPEAKAAQMAEGDESSADSQESSDELRDQAVVAISPEEQDALVKKVWGNLPTHLRKQISNTSMERFLPKYEKLTQEYFRKLAERKE